MQDGSQSQISRVAHINHRMLITDTLTQSSHISYHAHQQRSTLKPQASERRRPAGERGRKLHGARWRRHLIEPRTQQTLASLTHHRHDTHTHTHKQSERAAIASSIYPGLRVRPHATQNEVPMLLGRLCLPPTCSPVSHNAQCREQLHPEGKKRRPCCLAPRDVSFAWQSHYS